MLLSLFHSTSEAKATGMCLGDNEEASVRGDCLGSSSRQPGGFRDRGQIYEGLQFWDKQLGFCLRGLRRDSGFSSTGMTG